MLCESFLVGLLLEEQGGSQVPTPVVLKHERASESAGGFPVSWEGFRLQGLWWTPELRFCQFLVLLLQGAHTIPGRVGN